MLSASRSPRHDDRATAVAIPYRQHVTPTVLSLETGAYLAAWSLGGQTFECLSDAELEVAHERLNIFLRSMASPNISLWTHVIRDHAPALPRERRTPGFAGRLAARYRHRLDAGQLMCNTLYVSVVYKPSALSRVARTAHEEDQAAALAVMANLSRTLEANLAPYEPVALGVYEQGRRHYSRLLEFLARLVNACDERVPLNVAPAAQLLGTGRLLFGWETVEYRAPTWTRLAAFLGFKEYPNPTRAGMLDGLLAAPFPLVLTQSFTFLGRGTALGLMDRQAQRLGNAGDAAVSQVLALRTAIDALASGEFVMGDHHWSLQVLTPPFERDGSERVRVAALHESIAQARSMLADVGCLTAREDFAVAPAFWAQLPGNHAERPRLAPITSRNFAALAPLHAYPGGRASGNHWGPSLAQLRTRAGTL